MPRPMWKGAISFGLVVIPVRMYPATHPKSINFHFLHNKCLTRPKQMRYCEVDSEYFGTEETVKGYEYAKGQYVVIEDADFKKLPLKTLHSVEIAGFVASSEIDPVYYNNGYYLEPEELGIKPFALFREILAREQRTAVAKVTFQRREHLCCLRPWNNILMLHTMHYYDEVVPPSEEALTREVPQLSSEELKLAENLVSALAKRFRPEEYKDGYRAAMEKLVNAKLEGVELKAPKPPGKVSDLMAALRASIEAAQKKEPATSGATQK